MSLRRVYESTIIINAALEDSDIEAVISRICTYIENHGGVILEVDKWGRKRLAYPINKKYNGFYVHIVFDALPANIPIFERFLVLEDTVSGISPWFWKIRCAISEERELFPKVKKVAPL